MLYQFLQENQKEILSLTENKSNALAGIRQTSDQLKKGLPIFLNQLMSALMIRKPVFSDAKEKETVGMEKAAGENDEQAMAKAAGRPDEVEVAKTAGLHGRELLRLGYTLSHVVHAYGSMCQSITELASKKHLVVTADEFHDLNRCLDIAIAGAVTEYQSNRNSEVTDLEVEHVGFLAHELRNALTSANVAIQLIKKGTVGFSGNTGKVFDSSMKRIQTLVDRSLTEVRFRVDPKVLAEPVHLLQLIDQITVIADVDAKSRDQKLDIQIDPTLIIETDQQLLYTSLSNLIQNALKYTHDGGRIQVRGKVVGGTIEIEVEDECGGLNVKAEDLFKPFEQHNQDRTGLGLGLSIAQRAMMLNHGKIIVINIPGKGCIFRISLPNKATKDSKFESAA
jgi:signal transduction histidine kinase